MKKPKPIKITVKIDGYGKPCVFYIQPSPPMNEPPKLPKKLQMFMGLNSADDNSLTAEWYNVFTRRGKV